MALKCIIFIFIKIEIENFILAVMKLVQKTNQLVTQLFI